MSKWKGNIVNVSAPSTSGTPYTGRANGIWTVDIVGQLKQTGLWAPGISPPAAPAISSVTVSNEQVAIFFSAPTTLNGETVTDYTVNCSNGQVVTSSANPIVVTGLVNNTNYTFSIVSNSESGSSVVSNSITAAPSAGTVPLAPTINSVILSGATSVMISITAPTNNGGANITSYTAVSSPGNITSTLYQSGSGTITVTGLSQLVTYTFTVYATNSIGNSSISNASTSITTASVDTSFSSVVLLLTGNGANGVNTFTSADVGSRAMTTHGNTQVSTGVKKFGTGSIYLDGAGDRLTITDSTIMSFSGDFTIESWINCIDYRTVQNMYYNYVFNSVDASGGNWTQPYISAAVEYSGKFVVGFNGSAGGTAFSTSTAISMNTWYHFALVRSSGTITCYLNGVAMPVASGSQANNGTISQTGLIIGDSRWNPGSESWHGYIDDFRITKGFARYTANFTPPANAAPTQ